MGRHSVARATLALATIAAYWLGGGRTAGVAAAPSTTVPAPPSTAPYALVDGVFTAPDGSFRVAFSSVPTVAGDPAGFQAVAGTAGDDSETVTGYPLDAFGATAETSPDQRALLFLDASGTDIELLANTPTRLGPYPAAYFIARLTLDAGGPAAVYGAVVVREQAVDYVIYTDAGGDDAETGRAFVESFTLDLPLVAPTTTPTTTGPTPTPPDSSVGPAAAASSTTATTSPVPPGATVSYDGKWWITFPSGTTTPTLRASSEAGLTFTEYRATAGDDVLTVRVTEVPAGYEWDPTTVPGYPGVAVTPTTTDLGAVPAAGSSFEADAGTVRAVVADTGTQLVTAAYLDAGEPSIDLARAFLASLTFRS